MKKSVLILFAIFFGTLQHFAQTLENISGMIYSQSGTAEVAFLFSADTLYVQEFSEFEPLASYTLSADTIFLLDVDNGCDGAIGSYKFTIDPDTIHFTLANDPCTLRVEAFVDMHWVILTTSIGPSQLKEQLLIGPNPTTGALFLTKHDIGVLEVKIFDLMGSLVYQEQRSSNVEPIDLGALEKGTYILQVIGHSGTSSTKVVLQ